MKLRSSTTGKALAVVLAAVAAMGVTVFLTSSIQRTAEQQAFERIQRGEHLLTIWLERSDALRAYLQTGSGAGRRAFDRLAAPVRAGLVEGASDAQGAPAARTALREQIQSNQRWELYARIAVIRIARHGVSPLPLSIAKPRGDAGTAFIAANTTFRRVMESRRTSQIRSASDLADIIEVLSALLLACGGVALTLFGRRYERRRSEQLLGAERERAAAERRYADERRRFSQTLLAAESESGARELIARMIEAHVPGSEVAVVASSSAEHPTSGPPRTREPLLVGEQAIGSVSIVHAYPITDDQRRVIEDTVALGTPVLVNLRNLAVAEWNARSDSLTGLPNRRAMDESFRRMLAQAHRSSEPLSVVVIDLDLFKQFNDSHGHARGDALLLRIATAFIRTVRASDLIARVGGDEFVALLPATNAAGAELVAANIVAAAEAVRVPGIAGSVTATCGIATFPEDVDRQEALLELADRALYAAKDEGGDRVGTSPWRAGVAPPLELLESQDPALDHRSDAGADVERAAVVQR